MENDIEFCAMINEKNINISEIGKYDKFVTFKKDHYDQFQFVNAPFMFHTNEMTCEELTKDKIYLAQITMINARKKSLEKQIDFEYQKKMQKKIDKFYKLKNELKEKKLEIEKNMFEKAGIFEWERKNISKLMS